MFKNRTVRILLAVIGSLILAIGVYNIPFINDKLAWRVDELRTQLIYFFRPPEEAVFVPEQVTPGATSTLPPPQVRTPVRTPTIAPTQAGPTLTPTITPTPLPKTVSIPGVKYVDQHNRWNYCGPANLTMALNFWGWKGNRDDIAKVVKPGIQDPKLSFVEQGKSDKNVMMSELANFVIEQTDYNVVRRYGGNLDLLKRLIAAGFPVVIEKGYFERDANGKVTWMGHYLFVTGYDDTQQGFIVQDAYLIPGKNLISKYDTFQQGWRAFNFLFMVIYPPDREKEILSLLGPWQDDNWADQHALEIAAAEVKTLTGMDSFFAWFNQGTSHVQLLQYSEAAAAYDKAFAIYPTLGKAEIERPYRMMWYQTGPYRAYFQTGRYQDVVNLANTTFKTISTPTLEESLYWRSMAEFSLGDTKSAFSDMRETVRLNKNFDAGWIMLNQWGIKP
jgi:tetratricopeptide (TPR) repeat protein